MARTPSDHDQLLRKAAQDLLELISAEEVPQRIRDLARALGEALDGRQGRTSPAKPSGDEKV